MRGEPELRSLSIELNLLGHGPDPKLNPTDRLKNYIPTRTR
jgi:hypothetical protein